MAWIALLVVAVLSLHHWTLEPLLIVGTGLFEGRAIGWLLVVLLLWITAGPTAPRR